MFEAILREIQNHGTVILHRHSRPDGDALGSQFGLKYILQANFPDKTVYAVGDDPGNYRFIGGGALDEIPDSAYEGALAIILDSGAASLISDERYRLAAKTARIDHHIFTGKIADEEVIDSTYESCCGLITEFAMECGLALPAEAAKALYTGMITDSGRFRFREVSGETMRLAGLILDQGIDTENIYANLYLDEVEKLRFESYVHRKMKISENGVLQALQPGKTLGVLFRNNDSLPALCDALLRAGIPFTVSRKDGKLGKNVAKALLGLVLAVVPTTVVLALLWYDNDFTNLLSGIFNFNALNLFSHILSIAIGIPISLL